MYENIRVSPPPGFECLTLFKIEVIEYGKRASKLLEMHFFISET